MAKKTKKPAIHKATDVEIRNDPSLRWNYYRPWEIVWSDLHNTEVRFLRYEGDKIAVASLHGITELSDRVGVLQIRRPSTMEGYNTPQKDKCIALNTGKAFYR